MTIPWVVATHLFSLGVALAAAIVDAKHHRIPDILTLGIALIGLAGMIGWSPVSILLRIALALALLVFFSLFRHAVRGNFGFGDVKLIAALGLVTGFSGIIGTIAVACALGIVFGLSHGHDVKARIPFAPFLAIGFGIVSLTKFLIIW